MEINIKEKEQLLEKAIKQIEKEFGKDAIMLLSDSSIGDIEVISSGSVLLDYFGAFLKTVFLDKIQL